jgi:molybdenum cofactor cytidylyltransferase
MNLTQALRFSQSTISYPQSAVAFVGAGGKSTALFQLAQELSPAVVTTTTHLGVWQVAQADRHVIVSKDASSVDPGMQIGPGITLFSGPAQNDRLGPLDDTTLYHLHGICADRSRPLLIEADGSRQRPLKAPADHEPVIPGFFGTVVVVAGLNSLGKPLTEEFVHRPEIFARLSGLKPGAVITPEALVRVLTHPQGGLKNIPAGARRVALLNQADTPELQAQAKYIAEQLQPFYHAIVSASLNPQSAIPNQQSQIHAVYEPVAGIILAAGGSSRFGQPKQLLDWQGKPFVRAVAETALAAGLSPVIVVTGANAGEVVSALYDLPLTIHHNPDWQTGQSSSLQTGLRALPQGTGSVIFLLADQPQITPTVLRTLTERHRLDLSPIVAPQVQGQRANPVLFDRVTFPELMALTGDVGGRAVFSRFPLTYLPWHDEALLTDVDTPEDYDRLTNDH